MNDPNSYAGGANGWHQPVDLVGTVLNDRYRVLRRIGDGGMGTVYLAEHITLRKKVALKVLKQELCGEQTHVDRFLQEARAASMVAHENIVDIVDFGPVPGGSVFFAMEYLEGEDLAGLLEREHRLPWAKAQELMLQVVRALKAAHARGIIHRDLKPANCFLIKRADGSDLVKLLDFGIAKVTDETGESRGLTRTGAVFGTAKYMAPEQAMGEPADARTDIYAAAICLYELLTGVVPFDGDNFMRVLSRHLTEPLTLPSTMAPDAHISPIVEAVIVKALAKKPEDRYQNMSELEAALLAITPDGRLRGNGADPGPPMVGPHGSFHEGPGSTLWLGPDGHSGPIHAAPPSHPPEGRNTTVMLDPSAPAMPGFEPGGTIKLRSQWEQSQPAPAPPSWVQAPADAAQAPGGAVQEAMSQSGGSGTVITAHPAVQPSAHLSTGPAAADSRPPPYAMGGRTNDDATVFAVEQRSRAKFFGMLIAGGVLAVAAASAAASWLLSDGDTSPAIEARATTLQPSVAGKNAPSTAHPIAPPPTRPVLSPVEPEPAQPGEAAVAVELEPQPELEPTPAAPPEPTPTVATPTRVPRPTPSRKPLKPAPKETVKDSLDPSDFARGEAKARAVMRKCPGVLPGMRVHVEYTIKANGTVGNASVKTPLSSETVSCIVSALKATKFPASATPFVVRTPEIKL